MSRARSRMLVLALLGAAAGLAGCASTQGPAPGDVGVRMDRARDLMERGKHGHVVVELQQMLAENPGNRFADEAIFLLGRAYYEQGEYFEAEDRFRRVLRDFPESPFAPDCSYHLALALLSQSRPAPLDQAETLAALTQFRSFLSRYPDHALAERARGHIFDIRTKLAEKAFRNGKLYARIGVQRAARFYFEEKVLAEYADTPYGARATAAMAVSYGKSKRWVEAADWARRYLRENPDGEDAERMRELEREAIRRDPAAAEGVLPVSGPTATADSTGAPGEGP